MTIGGWVFLALVVLAVLFGIGVFNNLVRARNQFKNGFAQIDVQLQRRYDLIPNLVESTKAYLKHEKETLENVIAARNQAQAASRAAAARPDDAAAIGALGAAETVLGGALGRLMVVAEAYPDLKANQTIQQLMEELASTENKVSFSRQHFNDSVMSYNILREQFPNNVVAAATGFVEAKLLEIEEVAARKGVKVSF